MNRPHPVPAFGDRESPGAPPDADDMLRWTHPRLWAAARKRELARERAETEPEARPMLYRDTQFRSELEAGWAHTLDQLRIDWEYEKHSVKLKSGERYLPDFWLPAIRTFIEAKGTHAKRRHKPQELAQEVNVDVIVLIGWPAVMRQVTPCLQDPYLQWTDPLGYDTRLALCPECSSWQWMRAELSRQCRRCSASHSGLLAKAGEMPFYPATPGWPSWLGRRLCRDSRQTTISTMTRRSLRPARQP